MDTKLTEEELIKLELTQEQLKAVKAAERALQKANKLGVTFWDNYGTMTAYNSAKITNPVPDSDYQFNLYKYEEITYIMNLGGGFQAGNADDSLYFNVL